jgi:hypothetical protein
MRRRSNCRVYLLGAYPTGSAASNYSTSTPDEPIPCQTENTRWRPHTCRPACSPGISRPAVRAGGDLVFPTVAVSAAAWWANRKSAEAGVRLRVYPLPGDRPVASDLQAATATQGSYPAPGGPRRRAAAAWAGADGYVTRQHYQTVVRVTAAARERHRPAAIGQRAYVRGRGDDRSGLRAGLDEAPAVVLASSTYHHL